MEGERPREPQQGGFNKNTHGQTAHNPDAIVRLARTLALHAGFWNRSTV